MGFLEVKAEASTQSTSPEEVGGALNGVSKAFARLSFTSSAEVKVDVKKQVCKELFRVQPVEIVPSHRISLIKSNSFTKQVEV